jgi:phage replication initiation protein
MKEKSKIGFQGEISEENIILYDWFSVTSHADSPEDIIELLGFNPMQFEVLKGFYGYKNRYFYDGISIHFDGTEEMGINLEITGQGCRNFETFGNGDWRGLFKLFISNPKKYNITRLDIAYDDHEGLLNILKISKSTLKGWYVARSQNNDVVNSKRKSIKGITVNVGSKQSDVIIRIYDKAAERKIPDKHWIRCELQLRRERAQSFIHHILQDKPVGDVFGGVLNKYLRYVKPTGSDSNVRRWDTEQWWKKFVNSVEKISLFTPKDIEYNLSRVEKYIFKQAGNSIDTYIKCVGLDYFLKSLKERDTYLKQHQKELIKQFRNITGEEVGVDEYKEARIQTISPKPRE